MWKYYSWWGYYVMILKRKFNFLNDKNKSFKNIKKAINKMRYPDKAIKERVDGLWLAITSLFHTDVPIYLAIIVTTVYCLLFFSLLLMLLAFLLASFTTFICSVICVTVAIVVIVISKLAAVSFFVISALFFVIGVLILCIITRLWKLFFLLAQKTYKNIVLKYV